MRLSELKPCDGCGGKIPPVFTLVKATRHLVAPKAVNEVAGLTQMYGGNLLMAEAITSVASVTEPVDEKELWLCQECFVERLGDLYFEE